MPGDRRRSNALSMGRRAASGARSEIHNQRRREDIHLAASVALCARKSTRPLPASMKTSMFPPPTHDAVRAWVGSISDRSDCRVEKIAVAESAEWRVEDGAIIHRSRGFFTVVGLQWTPAEGVVRRAPFIEQREIGTLGFLMRDRDGVRQVLVQAKFEPGNVGFVQLAPTCQATESNARRLHGGDRPPFIDCFPRSAPGGLAYDVEQSEQGTRFLGKRNRNVLVFAGEAASSTDTHRWMDVESVLELMHCDHLVNTDARSVLACAPWRILIGRDPFSRYPSGFGAELRRSANAPSRPGVVDGVRTAIRAARARTTDPQTIRIQDLGPEGSVHLRHIRVAARGREVPAWDQPILESTAEGRVILACGRVDGVLHFLFCPRAEPGLHDKVELTATVMIAPGETLEAPPMKGQVMAECRQSEEGGRFYRDTNLYQILDIGAADSRAATGYWLTLADVRELLDEAGWMTNEARSALSLLLAWL